MDRLIDLDFLFYQRDREYFCTGLRIDETNSNYLKKFSSRTFMTGSNFPPILDYSPFSF